MEERGVIYCATGARFVDEAIESVKSLKEIMPQVPVCVFTDDPERCRAGGFDQVIELSQPAYSFFDKISTIQGSPYERTIFLDTDTYVCQDFTELFELGPRFEIAGAYEPIRQAVPMEGVPEWLPEINSGVIYFHMNDRVRALIERWAAQYSKAHRGDQASLRKVLFESDIRFHILAPEYNVRTVFPAMVCGRIGAKILHGREMDGPKYARKINRNVNGFPRIYLPDWTFLYGKHFHFLDGLSARVIRRRLEGRRLHQKRRMESREQEAQGQDEKRIG